MKCFFSLLLICLCVSVNAQHHEIQSMLSKINHTVGSLKSGSYIMHSRVTKFSSDEDTTITYRTFKSFFKKNPSDTLVKFKLASLSTDKKAQERAYDGKNLFTGIPWRGTLEVANVSEHAAYIKDSKRDLDFYPLFIYLNERFQFYNKVELYSKVQVVGEEVLAGHSVLKIKLGESKPGKYVSEAFFYVTKDNLLPIKQTLKLESLIGNVKKTQIFENWISDLKLESSVPDSIFNRQSFSSYNREILYVSGAKASYELLKNGSYAPEWELPSIAGRNIKLVDFKDKIVVLDFWYRACAPCLNQMADLQTLHDKFDKEKVVFIGVNTIDDPLKDKIAPFLANRKITMMNVFRGKSIQGLYNVVASPVLYVVDGQGKIIFSQDGYSNTLLKDVENVIKANLRN